MRSEMQVTDTAKALAIKRDIEFCHRGGTNQTHPAQKSPAPAKASVPPWAAATATAGAHTPSAAHGKPFLPKFLPILPDKELSLPAQQQQTRRQAR